MDGLAASYLDDPRAPMPTLRRLAEEGASAEGMVTSFPSVTWPSHTSLVTGASPAKHGIIGNSVIDRATGEQISYIGDRAFTKDECVRVPTLYDAVHQAGMKTAAILWPAAKGAASLDWNIPEPPEELDRYVTPGLAEELDQAGISIQKLSAWGWDHGSASIRDALYARVAVHLLDRHQPNLTLVHLVTPDAFQHDYGPKVDEAYWSVGDADDRIREIWEALQQPSLAGRSDLFVVSDHGFAPVEKQIRPNVLLRKMGLITLDGKGEVVERKAWVHTSGGSAGVYQFEREDLERTLAQLTAQLAEIEGIESVLGPEEFAAFGLPSPEENTQQADLMLSAEPGYGFNRRADGEEVVVSTESRTGAHGHRPNQRFMHATFVAAGAHIRPGVELSEIANLDVAPTVAAILGVELPEADGRVLTEILK
ncbi:MAG: alkaline phosphatase family protein [bacterium]|nr:alkaline phosphatase family protein [bacterium]